MKADILAFKGFSTVVCVITDEKIEEITNLNFSFTSQECSRKLFLFFIFRHDCLTSCHKNVKTM